jgi:hypothetical protein
MTWKRGAFVFDGHKIPPRSTLTQTSPMYNVTYAIHPTFLIRLKAVRQIDRLGIVYVDFHVRACMLRRDSSHIYYIQATIHNPWTPSPCISLHIPFKYTYTRLGSLTAAWPHLDDPHQATDSPQSCPPHSPPQPSPSVRLRVPSCPLHQLQSVLSVPL